MIKKTSVLLLFSSLPLSVQAATITSTSVGSDYWNRFYCDGSISCSSAQTISGASFWNAEARANVVEGTIGTRVEIGPGYEGVEEYNFAYSSSRIEETITVTNAGTFRFSMAVHGSWNTSMDPYINSTFNVFQPNYVIGNGWDIRNDWDGDKTNGQVNEIIYAEAYLDVGEWGIILDNSIHLDGGATGIVDFFNTSSFYIESKDGAFVAENSEFLSDAAFPNITAVPVPSAFWLFGSAILGLASRRIKK